ncbi:hypothetical protein VULLAG_LOCUS6672 [Vulpes lagopus]
MSGLGAPHPAEARGSQGTGWSQQPVSEDRPAFQGLSPLLQPGHLQGHRPGLRGGDPWQLGVGQGDSRTMGQWQPGQGVRGWPKAGRPGPRSQVAPALVLAQPSDPGHRGACRRPAGGRPGWGCPGHKQGAQGSGGRLGRGGPHSQSPGTLKSHPGGNPTGAASSALPVACALHPA